MDDYRLMADAIEAEIRDGRMRAGTRLAPQREFARTRGIATSTAARVYQELVRRGLVAGEIGRGTFVLPGLTTRPPRRASAPRAESWAEPREWSGTQGYATQGHATQGWSGAEPVDLEANFPVLAEQADLISAVLADLIRPDALVPTLEPTGPGGQAHDRAIASDFLARGPWTPDPDTILFTGSGRQAIAAAVAALVGTGQRLGVEEYTYPVVKSIAARLGVTLVPITMDGDGMVPEDLATVHRTTPLGAVYLQSALHNPLGVTMSPGRRAEIAATLAALNLTAIEDGVNCFLQEETPIVALAPAHTVYVDSLSKRVAAGLTVGMMIAPRHLRDGITTAIRSGTWTANGFGLAASTTLMADGTVARIVAMKREDASRRQRIVLDRLAGFHLRADPRAYHSWWELPPPWQAETFVSAAARHGISISPAAAFAVAPGRAHAVRLSNSSPTMEMLTEALDVLAGLARTTPEDASPHY